MGASRNVSKGLVDGNPLDERGEIIEHIDGSIAQPLDRLLLRGCGARREIPHEIWRRTIQSKAPRPWLELGAVVQGQTLSTYIARMCGRFTRNYTWEQIHALYRLTAPPAIPNLQPRFNACPTDPADTIVDHEGKRQLVEMRWGLVPFWWSKPLKELRLATFNARVETVTTKPFFREPFKNKRCLMPVSGYYEWQDTPEGKQPWYFTARDGSPVLTIAGLWDEWKNRDTGERLKSCAMIITEPNEFVSELHDRMPVLLKPNQFEHWLSGNMGVKELKPVENDYLQRRAVSRRINSSKADSNDPTLIDAVRQAA